MLFAAAEGGRSPQDGEGPEQGLFLQQPVTLTHWSEGEFGGPLGFPNGEEVIPWIVLCLGRVREDTRREL